MGLDCWSQSSSEKHSWCHNWAPNKTQESWPYEEPLCTISITHKISPWQQADAKSHFLQIFPNFSFSSHFEQPSRSINGQIVGSISRITSSVFRIDASAKHQFTLFNFRLLFHTFTICNYFKPIYFYLEKPCDEYPKVAKSTKSTKMRLQENET